MKLCINQTAMVASLGFQDRAWGKASPEAYFYPYAADILSPGYRIYI